MESSSTIATFGKNPGGMLHYAPRELAQSAFSSFTEHVPQAAVEHENLQCIETASHTLTMPRRAPTPLKVKKNILTDVVSNSQSRRDGNLLTVRRKSDNPGTSTTFTTLRDRIPTPAEHTISSSRNGRRNLLHATTTASMFVRSNGYECSIGGYDR